jgi:hypothetical protein
MRIKFFPYDGKAVVVDWPVLPGIGDLVDKTLWEGGKGRRNTLNQRVLDRMFWPDGAALVRLGLIDGDPRLDAGPSPHVPSRRAIQKIVAETKP